MQGDWANHAADVSKLVHWQPRVVHQVWFSFYYLVLILVSSTNTLLSFLTISVNKIHTGLPSVIHTVSSEYITEFVMIKASSTHWTTQMRKQTDMQPGV